MKLRISNNLNIGLVVAMARKRVIGHANTMPWHLPADLRHFRRITSGKSIIMGRKTYDSIGRPLPDRHNIVVTRQLYLSIPGVIPGLTICTSVEAALKAATQHFPSQEILIIGGQTLFEQTIDLASTLYITEIDLDVEGDTFFPVWNPSEWEKVSDIAHTADDGLNGYGYRFLKYTRSSV